MRGNKPVRPKGDATLIEAQVNLLLGRLKNCGASDYHLEFAIDTAKAGQNSLAYFAYELD